MANSSVPADYIKIISVDTEELADKIADKFVLFNILHRRITNKDKSYSFYVLNQDALLANNLVKTIKND